MSGETNLAPIASIVTSVMKKKTVTRDFTDKSEDRRFRANEFAVSSARRMTLPPILQFDDVLAQVDSAPVHVDQEINFVRLERGGNVLASVRVVHYF